MRFEKICRLFLRRANMLARLSALANPAPFADHGPFSKQRLDDRQAVVPRHVAGLIDAFEVSHDSLHPRIVAATESSVQAFSAKRYVTDFDVDRAGVTAADLVSSTRSGVDSRLRR